MLDLIYHSFGHTITIVVFVLSMMLLIEYLTVQTQDKIFTKIKKNNVSQILLAALLGVIPGCLGTFIAVSLYTHKIIKFPALVTVLIATSGDEAFVMFGEIPKQALFLNLILFVVSILIGFILLLFFKDKTYMKLNENMLHSHKTPDCSCFDKKMFIKDWQNLSFERALLVGFTTLILLFFLVKLMNGESSFEVITFIVVLLFTLFVVTTVPEHFLKEHFWKHVLKKHFLRIFLWVLGTILFIDIILPYLNISQQSFAPIAEKYFFLILLIAVAVGIIPESGPNLVFIFLFSQGYIPMSILMANSVSQDGHGSLPLLAESRKSFFIAKSINVIVGLLVGIAGFIFNF